TIVPSSPVVPYDDPTLLFANAGMNQFKDVFLGSGKRSYTRAVDTQKCIRVSGKHNDLEEVGRDTYHHTFFEMLGNWSFGDYYKKEAIEWGWDLLTNVWGLPKNRLWATVYKDDDEAEQLWKTVTDIDHSHVLRFGEKDNFWEMGETGPCGPCSEIHIDRTPNGTATASMVNAGVAEVMEIWNLVFIQYNRDASGKLTPLPAKHVDTGMGFERMCAVLQNKSSNYDTDVFTPIINRISELTGKPYDGRMSAIPKQQMEIDTAMRVIADHIRTLTFAIGDGAVPSNEGRGYVLRRLLRRAARFGRNLNMREPFVYKLVPTLVNTMGTVFPEIIAKSEQIQKIIKGEEEGFNATLDRGLEIFEEVVKKVVSNKSQVISGEDVFKLYDTYGFPVDLTALLALERGLKIDESGFNELMEEQRERSRIVSLAGRIESSSSASARLPITTSKDTLQAFVKDITAGNLQFIGYDELETTATLVKGGRHLFVLDATPFYGEAGGQVGDKGTMEVDSRTFNVYDTQKVGNLNVHILEESAPAILGQKVRAKVNAERRFSIMRNHTATHLVHAALRKILGTHVHQSGSLVAPDHLRFDFAHFSKVTEQELSDIEALVNDKIKENITLNHHRNIPFEEAKKMGALMFFGDKYGDRVNVVDFGEFSKEFCGGTHVKSTAEIGYFKFRSEGSVASGIRRIEAVTSDGARELLKLQDRNLVERIDYALEQLHQISELSKELAALNGNTSSSPESFKAFEQRIEVLKSFSKQSGTDFSGLKMQFNERSQRALQIENIILELAEKKKSIEKELSKYRLQSLSGDIEVLIQKAVSLNGAKLVSAKVSVGSMDELKSLGDTLRAKLGSGVGLLASVIDEKVALVCTVSDDLIKTKNVQAGKIVGAVAKLVGGAGGGKPHLATAGGKDVAKLDEALKSTEAIVKSFLND
ncbi:MAG: alanine--tRNA ligase, partial [Ignavibacteriales bacterium]|nr:alanine--tRNA ligase [Ignavibacteriales bacterium]